ncbi:MAG: hypothetical protein Q4G51_08915 [Dermatophilus congolensis]|nr:hypothetical protein [Dermatophilus congolensis]
MGESAIGGIADFSEAGPERPYDLLVVDVSRRGVRGRRTGSEPEARLEPPPGASANTQVTVEIGTLVSALEPLVHAVSRPPDQVVVSIASAAQALDPAELRAGLAVTTNAPVVVCDSLVTTLFGALGFVGAGSVIDLGAGVAGLATDLDRVWHRIDGWGPILGDRGSAAWLGAQGLSAGLRARDGVPGGSDDLLAAGRRAFGDESLWPQLLEERRAADVLADFAPVVGELAARGDEVAYAIIALGADHLADTLLAGQRVVPGEPIAATGELLLVDAVRVAFASALGKRLKFLTPAMGDSLAGAHHLARHLAFGGEAPHRPPFVYTSDQAALEG